MFFHRSLVNIFRIVGSFIDRELTWSATDRQCSNFESCQCVWRALSSHTSHHPQEVLLVQFGLSVHKSDLKPHSFYFYLTSYCEVCCSNECRYECAHPANTSYPPNDGSMVALVYDVGSTLNKHWIEDLCLQGCTQTLKQQWFNALCLLKYMCHNRSHVQIIKLSFSFQNGYAI